MTLLHMDTQFKPQADTPSSRPPLSPSSILSPASTPSPRSQADVSSPRDGEADTSSSSDLSSILVLLPDHSVRLYLEQGLTAADVTKEFPGHTLCLHSRGSFRPPLPPTTPLRLGATYYLVASPGTRGSSSASAGSAPRRLSLDCCARPQESWGIPAHAETDVSFVTGPVFPASCASSENRMCQAGSAAAQLRSRSAPDGQYNWDFMMANDLATSTSASNGAPQQSFFHNVSRYADATSPGGPSPTGSRLPPVPRGTAGNLPPLVARSMVTPLVKAPAPLCPYCLPNAPMSVSASWQPCAAHSAPFRMARSVTQNSATTAWQRASLAVTLEPDWLDCSCSITVGPTPSPGSARGQSPSAQWCQSPSAQWCQSPASAQRCRSENGSRKASPSPVCFNPILEELQQMEEAEAAGAGACKTPMGRNKAGRCNPILEELFIMEASAEGQGQAPSEGGAKRPLTRGVGSIIRTVRRAASWKSQKSSSKKRGTADEQEFWNAMPARFTAV